MFRRGVFIDLQNIYLTLKEVSRSTRLHFEAIKRYFDEPRTITLYNVFSCYDPDNQGQLSFLTAIGFLGFRVVSKPIHRLPDGSRKASMDLEIAIEVLSQLDMLDEVVLMTGDGDFRVLIDTVARRGKRAVVVGPDRYTSPDLIQGAHRFIQLSQIPDITYDRTLDDHYHAVHGNHHPHLHASSSVPPMRSGRLEESSDDDEEE